ncbi:Uncharacterised protein [Bacteroides pyogenes]|nr:Uncharacterised protein [Bacteroides pyogenes]
MKLIVAVAIVLLNLYVAVGISCRIPHFVLSDTNNFILPSIVDQLSMTAIPIFFIRKQAFMFCATPSLIRYEKVSSLFAMSASKQ